MNSQLRISKCIVQSGKRKGKRPRVTSPDRPASIQDTSTPSQMGGPSQPQHLPERGLDLSSDSSDDEQNLVSFAAIMNAAEDGGIRSQYYTRYLNLLPGQFFPDDSSDMEYSSATKLSNASSSPQFEEDGECSGSSSRDCTVDVIVFTKDANEDEVVEILE